MYFAESILVGQNFLAAECNEDELMNSVDMCQPQKNIEGPRGVVYMGEDVDRK